MPTDYVCEFFVVKQASANSEECIHFSQCKTAIKDIKILYYYYRSATALPRLI